MCNDRITVKLHLKEISSSKYYFIDHFIINIFKRKIAKPKNTRNFVTKKKYT